jgi:tripartite-type tricarboxylate transporter receptor subunit TctC
MLIGSMAIMGERSFAQENFPTKPLTLLVGFPPGGVSDTAARAIAPGASECLGQPVTVQNKPGAGGTIAIDFVVNSKPDGYTLINAGTSTLAYGMYTKGVKWGPKDFTLILGHSAYNYAFVGRADAPWKNFDEWVAYVRKNPGFKYGTYGALGTMHIVMEWTAKRLNLKLVPVHFKGDSPGIRALLGGHIQAHCAAGGHAAQVKAGKLRTILQVSGEPVDKDAASVGRLRVVLPDAPLDVVDLPIGVFGPKGIPPATRDKLVRCIKKATVDNPKFIKTHQLMNLPVTYYDPDEVQTRLFEVYERFGKLMKELGLERK